MALVEIESGPIAYDERGEGEPIVMLASGAHDRHDFDGVRDLLASRFRTIAPDWPAHGESPRGRAEASAMGFADVAEQFVEKLAPGALVVGNSVGGFAAGRLAIRRPELVRGLVLVDSGGFGGRPPHERLFCAAMSRPRLLRRVYPAFANWYMRPLSDADRHARDTGVATTRESPGLETVAGLWGSFSSPAHDLRPGAGSIAAPTLLVWGRRDPVIPPRLGRRAAAAIPGAELELLDTGHAPHVSDPGAFAALLADFAETVFATEPERAGG